MGTNSMHKEHVGHKVKWRRRAAARTARRASLVRFYESLAVSVIIYYRDRGAPPSAKVHKNICRYVFLLRIFFGKMKIWTGVQNREAYNIHSSR